jgi:hypothetical protein
MTGNASVTYVLKGHGAIDPAWMRGCLNLFKERRVNIRRLVVTSDALLSHDDARCFSMLEIQFALPAADAPNPFLGLLESTLQQQHWIDRTLNPSI